MANHEANQHKEQRIAWQGILVRFGLTYFALQIIPLHWGFYTSLFQLRWDTFVIDLINLVAYTPHFFGPESTFLDWVLIALVAGIGTAGWIAGEKRGRPNINDETLFYYLRILARYRLAAVLLVFGFVKLFPVFAPEPSLSHLNTGYGYFAHWKQLYLSLGVAPAYLSFLGVVEVTSAILLLFRRTAFLAVVFIIPFYGNIFLANLAYEGGGYVFTLFLLSLTFVLFLHDFRRFFSLVVNLQHTQPATLDFQWRTNAGQKLRLGLKVAFVLVFVVLYGSRSYAVYQNGSLYYPETPGIVGTQGLYNVSIFTLNGDTIAYSPDHPSRWKDVVFEQWNTISIRSNRPTDLFIDNGIRLQRVDSLRNYEYALVGDRQYYSYQIDTNGEQLTLQNRNPHYNHEWLKLDIARPDSSTIYLEGVDFNGDSLHIRLDRLDKKYLIKEVKKVGRSRLGFKL